MKIVSYLLTSLWMISAWERRLKASAAFAFVLMLGLWGACVAEAKAPEVRHRLQLHYDAPQNPDLRQYQRLVADATLFEGISEVISQVFVLPQDMGIYFAQCDESNAFYDPETREMTVCYELMADYADIFSESTQDDTELETQVLYATAFTFYHELGHAMVDQFELPITGREEDVVDEFAAILLLEAGEEGELALLSEIQHFGALAQAEQEDLENLPFWDEHSLDSQRFYNLACLLYGSKPDTYSELVSDEVLPEERAERCEAEVAQKRKSWDVLLTPHTRDDAI